MCVFKSKNSTHTELKLLSGVLYSHGGAMPLMCWKMA